ncbi:uncharacterized protein LOC111334067 isoform X2 [Stylophora pistillata]|uniref:uncharacterized protein LOC111334067 isoform X2 n=1 Tax=Stylophora pistillata TaxID=50429 RepID=UPI000C0564CD|nr:uncharacterized protein LOC111334067 isoform X2 [Stylophora pistillata]
MKFPLLISSLVVLTVIPRMDSKPAKLVPLDEEFVKFRDVLARFDMFRDASEFQHASVFRTTSWRWLHHGELGMKTTKNAANRQ